MGLSTDDLIIRRLRLERYFNLTDDRLFYLVP